MGGDRVENWRRLPRGENWRGALWVVIAMLLGLWLRFWFIGHGPRVTGDSLIYGDIAKNWLQHGIYGFSRTGGGVRPTLIRLPGYPLFLAGCFAVFGVEHYRAVMFVQAAVDIVGAAGVGWVLGQRGWWWGLWLGVLCPFTASYVGAPLTEVLSVGCVGVVFWGVVGWDRGGRGWSWWVGVIGVGMAYAVLLRPEQGLLAVAVVPVMGWMVWRRGGRFGAVVVAAVLVVVPLVPWTVRNWRTFHVFQPLAPRSATDPGEYVPVGFQRWYRTWGVDFISTDQVYWHYDSDPILVTDLPGRAFDSEAQYRTTAALLEEYNQTTTATPEFDRRFAALAEERIRAGWWRYHAWLPLARLGNMLLRPRTELLQYPLDWWRQRGSGFWVPVGFGVVNLGYLVLAGCGLWRWRDESGVKAAMVLFCLLRCAMLANLDNSEPRYTLELFPIFIVLGAAALSGVRGTPPPPP